MILRFYVDDLLICARDEVTCVADTVTLLNHLAQDEVAICKCAAHTKDRSFISTGNARADAAAKAAAAQETNLCFSICD